MFYPTDDTRHVQTEEPNDLRFDEFVGLYSADTNAKGLNAMQLVLAIAKFVFLNRYDQKKLANCFSDLTETQALELGEDVRQSI